MRRLLRILIRTLLVLLLLGAAAYLFRKPLLGGFVLRQVEQALADGLGGRYSVADLEGGWIGEIEEAPAEGPVTRLEFGRATATYDLWALVRGADPLDAIHSLTVTNARVDLDLTRPSGHPDPAPGPPSDPFAAVPARLPRVALTGEVRVLTAEGVFALEGLDLGTDGNDAVRIAAARVVVPERYGPGGPLRARVDRTGRESARFTSEGAVSGITIHEAAITADGSVRSRIAVGDAEIAVKGGEGGGTVDATGIDLAGLPAWVYGLAPNLERPASARIDATVAVSSLDPFAASAKVGLGGVRWRDVRVESAEVDVALEGGRVTVRRARVDAPEAQLDAEDVVVEPERPYFVGSVGKWLVTIPDVRALAPEVDRALAVEIHARGDGPRRVVIDQARVAGEGVRVSVEGAADLPEDPAAWRDTLVSAALSGELVDLAVDGRGFLGTVTFEGSARGPLGAPTLEAKLGGDGLTVEERTIKALRADVSLLWPRLDAREVRVETDAGRVVARGAADLEREVVEDGAYDVDIADLGAFLALFPGAPEAEGRVQGTGTFSFDGEGGVRGRGDLRVDDLVLDGEALGSLRFEARADRTAVEIERLDASGAWGEASARGVVWPAEERARVDALAFRHEGREASLEAPATVAWAGGVVDAAGLEIAVLGGRVAGRATWDGSVLDALIQGRELDLAALDPELEGRVAFLFNAEKSGYRLEVTARAIGFAEQRGDVFLRAVQDDAGLRVDRVTLQAGGALQVEGHAVLPWRFDRPGPPVRVPGREARGELTATVGDVSRFLPVEAAGATVTVRATPESLRATARVRDLAPSAGLVLRGDTWIEVTARADGVAAALRASENQVATLEGDLRIGRGLDWTRPDEWEALLREGTLEGRLKGRVDDLGVLKVLAPDLVHLAGRADLDAAVAGTAADPRVEASASLAGLSLKLPGDLPPLQEGEGRVRFDGKRLHVEGLRVKLGYSPLGAAGTVLFEDGAPSEVDVTVVGENVLLVRNRHLRLRADVDLALTGSLDAPRAAGTARITDALYSRPMQLLRPGGPASADRALQLFSIREEPFSRMTFDVKVTAEDTIRLSNNVVRGTFSADLDLGGTGEVPTPEGRIWFRETLVKLPSSSPTAAQGELRFAPENPFAPKLDAAAHTRMKGYDLEVRVTGQIPAIDVFVSSRPTLSQEDAILLLTTGNTREGLEREGGRGAVTAVGSYLGQSLLQRVSGPSDPDERTLLDRFEFAIGRDISRTGQETIETEFEITPRWYLRGERDRFDDYNMGVVWRLRFR